MSRRVQSAARLFAALLMVSAAACVREPGHPSPPPNDAPRIDAAPLRFAYDSLDARPVSSEALRGKPVVLAFVTTWDVPSQAQASFLAAMARHDAERVHYALVFLEPRSSRELVEVYRTRLGITFPVAMAETSEVNAEPGWGGPVTVPTVVVLDRDGSLVFRRSGIARSEELRVTLSGLDTRRGGPRSR